jgi:hypothetical protein
LISKVRRPFLANGSASAISRASSVLATLRTVNPPPPSGPAPTSVKGPDANNSPRFSPPFMMPTRRATPWLPSGRAYQIPR